MTTPEKLEELAYTVRLLRALSADIQEMDDKDAAETCTKAADIIEAQAAEIARMKANESDIMAEHSEAMTKAAQRAEAAEARIDALTKERDDYARLIANDVRATINNKVERERDEARTQVTELTVKNENDEAEYREMYRRQAEAINTLTAENAVAREIIAFALETPGMIKGRDQLKAFLSTPNPKAMRMVEVVKAAQAWQAATGVKEAFQKRDALCEALAALTEGEKG